MQQCRLEGLPLPFSYHACHQLYLLQDSSHANCLLREHLGAKLSTLKPKSNDPDVWCLYPEQMLYFVMITPLDTETRNTLIIQIYETLENDHSIDINSVHLYMYLRKHGKFLQRGSKDNQFLVYDRTKDMKSKSNSRRYLVCCPQDKIVPLLKQDFQVLAVCQEHDYVFINKSDF